MKIKNLKINQKIITKLSSCVLVGSLTIMTLTGCGSMDSNASNDRNYILKGTILENARVITFDDGTKEIAVVDSYCIHSNYSHYYSIISGEYFSDEKCRNDVLNRKSNYKYVITNDESITKYLTADDLTKASQGELTNDDVINIVTRVINPDVENKIKTK